MLVQEILIPKYLPRIPIRHNEIIIHHDRVREIFPQVSFPQTADYGHFGRNDIEFPWERTDKAEALKSAAGL